jgi:hypothetical protein
VLSIGEVAVQTEHEHENCLKTVEPTKGYVNIHLINIRVGVVDDSEPIIYVSIRKRVGEKQVNLPLGSPVDGAVGGGPQDVSRTADDIFATWPPSCTLPLSFPWAVEGRVSV